MPRATPTGALDAVERQIRRVRWERNLHELQRAVYLLIAAGAAAAAVLVPFALFAGGDTFAVAAWGGAALLLAAAGLVGRRARRRWLRARGAVPWIERRAGLRGELRTLVEIARRGAARREAFFLPLLVAENARRLALWTPRRLVPRRVPRGALAAALLATAALALVLARAPGALPRPAEVVWSDDPIAWSAGTEAEDDPFGRLVIGPERRRRDRREGAVAAPGAAGGERPALARLSDELQERIRHGVWGEAWERLRDAVARLEEAARRDAEAREATRGEAEPGGELEAGEEWEVARAPDEDAANGTERPPETGAGRGLDQRSGAGAARGGAADAPATAASGGEGIAARAGNLTDPNLFGPPGEDAAASRDSFRLGLATRVRGRSGADREPAGEAPPPAPDRRPALGPGQRREAAAHRMTVPPAFEPIVREVFGHRGPDRETRP